MKPAIRPDQADAIKTCSDRQLRGQTRHLGACWHVWNGNAMETVNVLTAMKNEAKRRAASGKVRRKGI